MSPNDTCARNPPRSARGRAAHLGLAPGGLRDAKDPSMKVVHVVESLAVGGLEQVVISLAAWQRTQGLESTIVCLFHEGALAAGARARGVEVAVIGKASGLDVRALYMLRSSLRRLAPDVLHTHNAVAHYYAVAAAVGLGIARTVNTRHGMGNRAGERRLERLYRVALRRTDVAVAVCTAARDGFVRAGIVPAAKAVVVANGVDLGAIAVRSTTAREALLAQLALAPATVVLGVVGRLNPVKDHTTLLKALHLLRQKDLPVALVVVGDGPTRAALEAQAGRLGLDAAVRFLGMRGDVGQLLAAFDVFVLSSTTEGYSLALVEAAAAALPIVATRVGGNADIVSDGVSGLLVPAQDEAALAAAIGSLACDPALRARMGEAGRAWALAHGSLDAMGNAYLALYRGTAVPGKSASRRDPSADTPTGCA